MPPRIQHGAMILSKGPAVTAVHLLGADDLPDPELLADLVTPAR